MAIEVDCSYTNGKSALSNFKLLKTFRVLWPAVEVDCVPHKLQNVPRPVHFKTLKPFSDINAI